MAADGGRRIATLLSCLTLLLASRPAAGYDVSVTWQSVPAASGYTVHVRVGQGELQPFFDLGALRADAAGRIRVVIQGLPLDRAVGFAVSGYDSSGQHSKLSGEIGIDYARAALVIDSDGDGLTDGEEDVDLDLIVDAGETNPQDIDSDRDGLSDGDEVHVHFTNPVVADSDGDGVGDGDELDAGTDPNRPDNGSGDCGNGSIEPGEQCDDGNRDDSDGCLSNCSAARCGDGVVHVGVEECDAGASNRDRVPTPCRTDCTLALCTESVGGHGCDDGNVCTDDRCHRGLCRHVANTLGCDDGVVCTTDDLCRAGVCAGSDACADGETCNAATGRCELAPAASELWIGAATDADVEFRGAMRAGTEFTGGADADPLADSVLSSLVYPDSATTTFGGGSGDEALYRIELAETGEWYLWGRFYYPGAPGGNDPNSFYVRVDGGQRRIFGNNLNRFRRWHWDGEGRIQDDPPRPVALGVLEAGEHLLVVEKREAGPTLPRVDVLYLTHDPGDVPNDERARQALVHCSLGTCRTENGLCGDATQNGELSVADAWTILNVSLHGSEACTNAACDVDANGVISATDALAVLQWSVGIEVDATVCEPRPAQP